MANALGQKTPHPMAARPNQLIQGSLEAAHETPGCDLGNRGLSRSGLLGGPRLCDTTGYPSAKPPTACGSGGALSHLSDLLCRAPLPYFVEVVSSDQRCNVRGGRSDPR